jgi:glucosamine-6-phosphate isomerase
MQLKIYKDHRSLSQQVAYEILDLVKAKPDAVLCLASGDTPLPGYRMLAEQARKEKIDFSRCTFIGLDEWVGIPPQNEGSCQHFFQKNVFAPLNIPADHIYLFDALSDDLPAACKKMDRIIAEKGGIDLMIVGVGLNGHIGFNEPGSSFEKLSHVTELDETTITVGQKYFLTPVELKQGITLGLLHLLQSRRVVMIANGAKKAGIIKLALEEEISTNLPCTILKRHEHGIVMIDEEAACLLKK